MQMPVFGIALILVKSTPTQVPSLSILGYTVFKVDIFHMYVRNSKCTIHLNNEYINTYINVYVLICVSDFWEKLLFEQKRIIGRNL